MYMKIGWGKAEPGNAKQGRDALEQAARCSSSRGRREGKRALLMENDRVWEAEFVGRALRPGSGQAWAGHSGDTGVDVERVLSQSLVGFLQRRRKVCAG